LKTKEKTYTAKEFSKLYREEYFDFDFQGHEENREHIDAEILRSLDFIIKQSEKHEKDDLISFYNRGPAVGFPFSLGLGMVSFKCEHCGKKIYLGLIDEKTISVFTNKEGDNFDIVHNEDDNCEFEDGIPYHKSVLNLEEELIFINAFRKTEGGRKYLFPNAPEGKEYDDEFELSSIKGRQGINKHKESQNVAYGAMSNMSIGVYANKDRTHFIISNAYLDDYEEIEYDQEVYDRYKKTLDWLNNNEYEMLGRICLSVWMWEATDRKTLDKNGYNQSRDHQEYEDMVSVKIPSGKWELTHKFDSYDFGFNFTGPAFKSDMEIYSELKLIE